MASYGSDTLACMTQEETRALVNDVDTFVFDCDGVLWSGTKPIPGSAEAVAKLKKMGKRVLYVTNNSTRSRESFAKLLVERGFMAYQDDVIGSSYVAAQLLKITGIDGKKVYAVGMSGLYTELRNAGFVVLGEEDNDTEFDMASMEKWQPDPQVGVVVVGLDFKVNFLKLAKACVYLQRPDVLFVATNDDTTLPLANNIKVPGAGSILSVLTTATARQPVVCGKPNIQMLNVVLDRLNTSPERSCMVGDRLDTDIAFGQAGGMKTVLVLTGVSTLDNVAESTQVHPSGVLEDAAGLTSAF